MGCRNLCAVLVIVSLAAGCGKSASSPSSVSDTSSVSAQAAVMSVVTQAMSQIALIGRTTGDTPNTVTSPCAGGGSIVMTVSPLPLQQPIVRSSSRLEFHDCRHQTVTIDGDPYLETSMEISFPPLGVPGDSVSTMRTIGGLRLNSNGVQGRVQFNCTTTVSISMANGSTPQVSVSSSGTTTFEQPLGSTPVVRPCGPS